MVASYWYGFRFTRLGACVHTHHFTMASTDGQGAVSAYGYVTIDAMYYKEYYQGHNYYSLVGTTYLDKNCKSSASTQWTNVWVPKYNYHRGSMAKKYMTAFDWW